MADSSVVSSDTPSKATAAAASASKKKGKKGGAAAAKKVATHPKTYDMVINSVKELKEKKGSSLQAIKKYIAAHYKVDTDKTANFIRKALKKAVTDGALVQTKGTGASGSFKLAGTEKASPKKKKSSTTPKKKKAASAAASPATKKKAKVAKPAAKKATTPKKKKAAKATTPKKSKSPKPKKVPSKPKAKKTGKK